MKIADCHNDILTNLNETEIKKFLKNNISDVDIICCAIFTTDKALNIDDIKRLNSVLTRINKFTNIKLILTIEDLGNLKTIDEINQLIKLRPFSCTLTWNYANQYAGGALTNGGLKRKGRELIKILIDKKIFVDTAHMSRKSFWQFAKLTKRPILNSHANIYSLHKHPRNLTNRQIKAIVDSHGFLGITLYDEFIAGAPIDALDVARQIDYLIKKFGCHNFGLGTDFFGIEPSHLPRDIENYQDLEKVAFYLYEWGYSNEIVEAIFYKNLENFIEKNK